LVTGQSGTADLVRYLEKFEPIFRRLKAGQDSRFPCLKAQALTQPFLMRTKPRSGERCIDEGRKSIGQAFGRLIIDLSNPLGRTRIRAKVEGKAEQSLPVHAPRNRALQVISLSLDSIFAP
jgi:hypothetical protein